MKLGTQIDKLQKKIEKERELKQKSMNDRTGGYLFMDSKRKKPNEDVMKKRLNLLKRLLDMIDKGTTGFELAYEVEKNQEVKKLIYDGILFYNTFLEIGNKKFIEAPDKTTIEYKSFKTIEDTEKYIFMVWLKDTINSLEKEIQPMEDYAKFIEEKRIQEAKEAMEKLRQGLTHCKNCGARIKSKDQEFCEECGMDIMKSIL